MEGDTVENLKTIADYAVALGCDFAQFIPAEIWHEFTSARSAEGVSAESLARLSTRAYLRFYLRPAFAVRMMGRVWRPRMMKAAVRSAYRIVSERQIY